MSKASFYCYVNNADNKHDSGKIKRELDLIPGVTSVSVGDSAKTIAVDFDTSGVQRDQIKRKIEKMGYAVVDFKLENHIM